MAHKYRLYPTGAQAALLRGHIGQCRLIHNLCVEQFDMWREFGRYGNAPSFKERSVQLTQLRRFDEVPWMSTHGSAAVHQQALANFNTAVSNFFAGRADRPTFKKRGRRESFRVRDVMIKVNHAGRCEASVFVPKVGYVDFQMHRKLPEEYGMGTISVDGADHWYISFAAPQPEFERELTGKEGGLDLGITCTITLNDGRVFRAPRMSDTQATELVRLKQQLSRQVKGSMRRKETKRRIAKIYQEQRYRLHNWIERITTQLVREYDFLAVEALKIVNMVATPDPKPDPDNEGQFLPNGAAAKAGLNKAIHEQAWGRFILRLQQKAAAAKVLTQVIKVNPAYTSLTCPRCKHCAAENRESQAVFKCIKCGLQMNADKVGATNVLVRGLAAAAALALSQQLDSPALSPSG